MVKTKAYLKKTCYRYSLFSNFGVERTIWQFQTQLKFSNSSFFEFRIANQLSTNRDIPCTFSYINRLRLGLGRNEFFSTDFALITYKFYTKLEKNSFLHLIYALLYAHLCTFEYFINANISYQYQWSSLWILFLLSPSIILLYNNYAT